jgi:Protein of unknown function (DUF1071)
MSNYTTLAAINVNDKIEKKNGLSYLSWAWAVDQLLRADPAAQWFYGEPVKFGETMMVFCTVEAFGKRMTSQLPVMDYKNKAIPNPDAFQVNTAMQRCLAKAIALHGLGLYIYAGEDVPETDNTISPVKESLKGTDLSAQKKDMLEALATECIDEFKQGNEITAIKIAHSIEDNEEKIYFWGLLKTESKLRALIKANARGPA